MGSPRRVIGDRFVYDGDRDPNRPSLPEERIVQYKSDIDSSPGQRIAVNQNFICFALNSGKVRVISHKNGSRCLLPGDKRVTDMKFFSADVDLLASVNGGGYLIVWKIVENDEEIEGCKVKEVLIGKESDSIHPLVLWRCRKQDVLIVGIGRTLLRIDDTQMYSTSNQLRSHNVGRTAPGINFVGDHEGEITDLSMCIKEKVLLVSASNDGKIKIWNETNVLPIAQFIPHDGNAVSFARFITLPNHSGDVVLVTGSSSSAEVKLWTLNFDKDCSWQCIQTLKAVKDSGRPDQLVFDQLLLIAQPQPGLLVLVNSKSNIVYTIQLIYDQYPRMDYITQFVVAMPILSFTGTSDFSHGGDWIIRLYCIMTEAVSRYTLDLSCCCAPSSSSLAPSAPISRQDVQQLKDVKKILNELVIMQKESLDKISVGIVQESIEKKIEPRLKEQDLAEFFPDLVLGLTPIVEQTMFTAIAEGIQLLQMPEEMQNRNSPTVPTAITKEGRRLEAVLRNSMEKCAKANSDALRARYQEENMKQEKLLQKWKQEFLNLVMSSLTKDLPAVLEENLKKEMAAVARSSSPALEETMSTIIAKALQTEGPPNRQKKLCILMVRERMYEEAFNVALKRTDVSIVYWLCAQVNLSSILRTLNQELLLRLLEQLALDIDKDTSQGLIWMRDVAVLINPADVMIAQHGRQILERVSDILYDEINLPNTPSVEISSMHVVMQIIDALLVKCLPTGCRKL